MHHKTQLHKAIFGIGWNSALALTLVLLVLIVVVLFIVFTAQPAQAQAYSVLYNFTGGFDGGAPSGLKMDAGGNFYGTSVGHPVVWRFRRAGSGWILTPIDSSQSSATVDIAADGTLYAASTNNIFHLTQRRNLQANVLSPWISTTLYNFSGNSGYQLNYELALDQSGNVYGSTFFGGPSGACDYLGCGVVFELSPSGGGWTENIIYAPQNGSDGRYPTGGVVFHGSGNLFGLNSAGGNGNGTMFELSPSGDTWMEQTLYTFSGGSEGGSPEGVLTFDSAGNAYGTTNMGGSYGDGTLFELSPSASGWTGKALWNFSQPTTKCQRVAVDPSGSVYCSTPHGGVYGNGSIFKLSPSQGGWTYITLHDFTGGSDGGFPYGNDLVLDANGNLYGTAWQGGAYGQGVIWKITP